MAASSSSSTKYTKLRRDSSRDYYNLWKITMLRRHKSWNLNRFVDGSHPPPTETNSQAHRKWQWNDGIVIILIAGAVSRELIPVVTAGGRTSRDVWVQLEFIFPPPFGILPREDGGYRLMSSRLYKFALSGEWDATKEELDRDRRAAEVRSFPNLNTVLHIAVGTGKAIPYLKNLVAHAAMTVESLAATDDKGRTALHVAAQMGNLEAATELVRQCSDLLYMVDNFGHFPVVKAAQSRHRPTVDFFIDNTTDPTPYAADNGVTLLNTLIDNSFLDIALDLIKDWPDMARRKHSSSGHSALRTIALNSAAFKSGARFNPRKYLSHSQLRRFYIFLLMNWSEPAISMLPGGDTKYTDDQKVMHNAAVKLVKCVCVNMEEGLSDIEAASIYVDAMLKAAELGVHEVIEEIVEIFPQAIYSLEINSRRNLFHMAVENRCEKVFNLIYQMSDFKYEFSSIRDNAGDTLLHKVAHLAPPHILNLVSGAALQMQRELQWFKEVDKFVKVDNSERLNSEGRTPEMIFTEEHSKLREAGEKWMKDTASSFSISAALLTTVMFTAVINVHVGEDKQSSSYKIMFAVSGGLSLFASSISLLLFLSILTSPCAEEDFLYTLPKRLCVGLSFLYFSIAFTLEVLISTVVYLGRDHMNVVLNMLIALTLASIIIGFFIVLQFPLLGEIISSTYAHGVFGKQSARPFH